MNKPKTNIEEQGKDKEIVKINGLISISVPTKVTHRFFDANALNSVAKGMDKSLRGMDNKNQLMSAKDNGSSGPKQAR